MSQPVAVDILEVIAAMKAAPTIGTPDHPYEVLVPRWFEERCLADGTTPQEVYDRVFAGSSFQHGVVIVVEPM